MLYKIFFKKRYDYLTYKKQIYEKFTCEKDQNIIVIDKFNKLWKQAYNQIPFYNYWKKEHSLPEKITNFQELYNFPILTSEIIRDHKDKIISKNDKYIISTGGSTGKPTVFPGANKNYLDFFSNIHMGRGWWNINPQEKKLLIWGHSHLFGTGIRGQINQYISIIKNYLNNTKKLDAYNMSASNIETYYNKMLSFKPDVIIGYTSALVRLADYIINNKFQSEINFRIKAVIPTAENITDYDVSLIEKAFLSKVVIEYGMAEAGVIAYSYKETRNLKIFWDSFICSIKQDELIITTLDRQQFPLINYATRDIVETDGKNKFNVRYLNKIHGRKKDFYEVKNLNSKENYIMSGIFAVHAIKQYKGILSVQIKLVKEKKIKIQITSNNHINLKDLKRFFFLQTKLDFPNIDEKDFEFEQVLKAKVAISGKENITI